MMFDDLYINFYSNNHGIVSVNPENALYYNQQHLIVYTAYVEGNIDPLAHATIGLEVSTENLDVCLCIWYDQTRTLISDVPNYSIWPEKDIGDLEDILRDVDGGLVTFHFSNESNKLIVKVTKAVADELLRRILFARRELEGFKLVKAIEEI